MTATAPRPNPPLRSFVLVLGLVVCAVAAWGFGHSVDERLIHFNGAPPPILYVHVLVSIAWLAMFVTQAALVRNRNVRLHRRLGTWGLGLGAIVGLVGLATVIVLRRADIAARHGAVSRIAFLAIPMLSLLEFAVPFTLAALWRKRTGLHRRLMVLATVSLTGAAFVRFPGLPRPAGAVLQILLMVAAAAADWRQNGKPHPVYLIGIPAVIVSQQAAVWLITAAPPWWVATARLVLGL